MSIRWAHKGRPASSADLTSHQVDCETTGARAPERPSKHLAPVVLWRGAQDANGATRGLGAPHERERHTACHRGSSPLGLSPTRPGI